MPATAQLPFETHEVATNWVLFDPKATIVVGDDHVPPLSVAQKTCETPLITTLPPMRHVPSEPQLAATVCAPDV